MIKIIFFYYKDLLCEFEINGHAPRYICSGVSVLAINSINAIAKFCDDDFTSGYDKNGGNMKFKFLYKNISREAVILIKALELGLKDLEKKYANHVSIKSKNIF